MKYIRLSKFCRDDRQGYNIALTNNGKTRYMNPSLNDTLLRLHLSAEEIATIANKGEFITVDPNSYIFKKYSQPGFLYIVVQGCVKLDLPFWRKPVFILPGHFFGELSFVLGTKTTFAIKTHHMPVVLWKIRRDILLEPSEIVLKFIKVVTNKLQIRLNKLTGPFKPRKKISKTFLDRDDYSIKNIANHLRGDSEEKTVDHVFSFVRSMPYRFGFWQLSASQVLGLGYGMCTSKATLQAALLAQHNIAFRFMMLKKETAVLNCLIPDAYLDFLGEYYKHYFIEVNLDGQWYICDATFPDRLIEKMAKSGIDCADLIGVTFSKEKAVEFRKRAIYDDAIPVLDFGKVLAKQAFYDEDHIESMNTVLDEIQGVSIIKSDNLILDDDRVSFAKIYERSYVKLQSTAAQVYNVLVKK